MSITPLLQANATAAVIQSATGTMPVVRESNGIYYVTPKKEDVPIVQAKLRELLNTKKEPSPVQVNYQAAVTPVLIEKYGGVLFFGAAALMFIGYNMKRRRK